MKTAAVFALLASTASAFAPATSKASSTALKMGFDYNDVGKIPGATPPTGIFDPFGFTSRSTENQLKRFRESELAHGRVAMLAVVGFLVGEKVEGTSFLFAGQIRGPAIDHLQQVPQPFWSILAITIGALEISRAQYGWVPPRDVPAGQPGLLRQDYAPGDLGFDPLGLRPSDPQGFLDMQNKELNNGRLAMIAAAGFIAQELVDHKGIIEWWTTNTDYSANASTAGSVAM